MILAAGERIVAFARPGKPPESPFYRWIELIPGTREVADFRHIATVFKVRWA
jgi:hypothetical protein